MNLEAGYREPVKRMDISNPDLTNGGGGGGNGDDNTPLLGGSNWKSDPRIPDIDADFSSTKGGELGPVLPSFRSNEKVSANTDFLGKATLISTESPSSNSTNVIDYVPKGSESGRSAPFVSINLSYQGGNKTDNSTRTTNRFTNITNVKNESVVAPAQATDNTPEQTKVTLESGGDINLQSNAASIATDKNNFRETTTVRLETPEPSVTATPTKSSSADDYITISPIDALIGLTGGVTDGTKALAEATGYAVGTYTNALQDSLYGLNVVAGKTTKTVGDIVQGTASVAASTTEGWTNAFSDTYIKGPEIIATELVSPLVNTTIGAVKGLGNASVSIAGGLVSGLEMELAMISKAFTFAAVPTTFVLGLAGNITASALDITSKIAIAPFVALENLSNKLEMQRVAREEILDKLIIQRDSLYGILSEYDSKFISLHDQVNYALPLLGAVGGQEFNKKFEASVQKLNKFRDSAVEDLLEIIKTTERDIAELRPQIGDIDNGFKLRQFHDLASKKLADSHTKYNKQISAYNRDFQIEFLEFDKLLKISVIANTHLADQEYRATRIRERVFGPKKSLKSSLNELEGKRVLLMNRLMASHGNLSSPEMKKMELAYLELEKRIVTLQGKISEATRVLGDIDSSSSQFRSVIKGLIKDLSQSVASRINLEKFGQTTEQLAYADNLREQIEKAKYEPSTTIKKQWKEEHQNNWSKAWESLTSSFRDLTLASEKAHVKTSKKTIDILNDSAKPKKTETQETIEKLKNEVVDTKTLIKKAQKDIEASSNKISTELQLASKPFKDIEEDIIQIQKKFEASCNASITKIIDEAVKIAERHKDNVKTQIKKAREINTRASELIPKKQTPWRNVVEIASYNKESMTGSNFSSAFTPKSEFSNSESLQARTKAMIENLPLDQAADPEVHRLYQIACIYGMSELFPQVLVQEIKRQNPTEPNKAPMHFPVGISVYKLLDDLSLDLDTQKLYIDTLSEELISISKAGNDYIAPDDVNIDRVIATLDILNNGDKSRNSNKKGIVAECINLEQKKALASEFVSLLNSVAKKNNIELKGLNLEFGDVVAHKFRKVASKATEVLHTDVGVLASSGASKISDTLNWLIKGQEPDRQVKIQKPVIPNGLSISNIQLGNHEEPAPVDTVEELPENIEPDIPPIYLTLPVISQAEIVQTIEDNLNDAQALQSFLFNLLRVPGQTVEVFMDGLKTTLSNESLNDLPDSFRIGLSVNEPDKSIVMYSSNVIPVDFASHREEIDLKTNNPEENNSTQAQEEIPNPVILLKQIVKERNLTDETISEIKPYIGNRIAYFQKIFGVKVFSVDKLKEIVDWAYQAAGFASLVAIGAQKYNTEPAKLGLEAGVLAFDLFQKLLSFDLYKDQKVDGKADLAIRINQDLSKLQKAITDNQANDKFKTNVVMMNKFLQRLGINPIAYFVEYLALNLTDSKNKIIFNELFLEQRKVIFEKLSNFRLPEPTEVSEQQVKEFVRYRTRISHILSCLGIPDINDIDRSNFTSNIAQIRLDLANKATSHLTGYYPQYNSYGLVASAANSDELGKDEIPISRVLEFPVYLSVLLTNALNDQFATLSSAQLQELNSIESNFKQKLGSTKGLVDIANNSEAIYLLGRDRIKQYYQESLAKYYEILAFNQFKTTNESGGSLILGQIASEALQNAIDGSQVDSGYLKLLQAIGVQKQDIGRFGGGIKAFLSLLPNNKHKVAIISGNNQVLFSNQTSRIDGTIVQTNNEEIESILSQAGIELDRNDETTHFIILSDQEYDESDKSSILKSIYNYRFIPHTRINLEFDGTEETVNEDALFNTELKAKRVLDEMPKVDINIGSKSISISNLGVFDPHKIWEGSTKKPTPLKAEESQILLDVDFEPGTPQVSILQSFKLVSTDEVLLTHHIPESFTQVNIEIPISMSESRENWGAVPVETEEGLVNITNQILDSNLSTSQKIAQLNTILIWLDNLSGQGAKSTPLQNAVSRMVNVIKSSDFLNNLPEYCTLLPNTKEYLSVEIPDGKEPVYIDQRIADWNKIHETLSIDPVLENWLNDNILSGSDVKIVPTRLKVKAYDAQTLVDTAHQLLGSSTESLAELNHTESFKVSHTFPAEIWLDQNIATTLMKTFENTKKKVDSLFQTLDSQKIGSLGYLETRSQLTKTVKEYDLLASSVELLVNPVQTDYENDYKPDLRLKRMKDIYNVKSESEDIFATTPKSEIESELFNFIDNNPNLNESTKRILQKVAKTIFVNNSNLVTSRKEYKDLLFRINKLNYEIVAVSDTSLFYEIQNMNRGERTLHEYNFIDGSMATKEKMFVENEIYKLGDFICYLKNGNLVLYDIKTKQIHTQVIKFDFDRVEVVEGHLHFTKKVPSFESVEVVDGNLNFIQDDTFVHKTVSIVAIEEDLFNEVESSTVEMYDKIKRAIRNLKEVYHPIWISGDSTLLSYEDSVINEDNEIEYAKTKLTLMSYNINESVDNIAQKSIFNDVDISTKISEKDYDHVYVENLTEVDSSLYITITGKDINNPDLGVVEIYHIDMSSQASNLKAVQIFSLEQAGLSIRDKSIYLRKGEDLEVIEMMDYVNLHQQQLKSSQLPPITKYSDPRFEAKNLKNFVYLCDCDGKSLFLDPSNMAVYNFISKDEVEMNAEITELLMESGFRLSPRSIKDGEMSVNYINGVFANYEMADDTVSISLLDAKSKKQFDFEVDESTIDKYTPDRTLNYFGHNIQLTLNSIENPNLMNFYIIDTKNKTKYSVGLVLNQDNSDYVRPAFFNLDNNILKGITSNNSKLFINEYVLNKLTSMFTLSDSVSSKVLNVNLPDKYLIKSVEVLDSNDNELWFTVVSQHIDSYDDEVDDSLSHTQIFKIPNLKSQNLIPELKYSFEGIIKRENLHKVIILGENQLETQLTVSLENLLEWLKNSTVTDEVKIKEYSEAFISRLTPILVSYQEAFKIRGWDPGEDFEKKLLEIAKSAIHNQEWEKLESFSKIIGINNVDNVDISSIENSLMSKILETKAEVLEMIRTNLKQNPESINYSLLFEKQIVELLNYINDSNPCNDLLIQSLLFNILYQQDNIDNKNNFRYEKTTSFSLKSKEEIEASAKLFARFESDKNRLLHLFAMVGYDNPKTAVVFQNLLDLKEIDEQENGTSLIQFIDKLNSTARSYSNGKQSRIYELMLTEIEGEIPYEILPYVQYLTTQDAKKQFLKLGEVPRRQKMKENYLSGLPENQHLNLGELIIWWNSQDKSDISGLRQNKDAKLLNSQAATLTFNQVTHAGTPTREAVANQIDAGASKILLNIDLVNIGSSQYLRRKYTDNGKGMSAEVLVNKFLNPTSSGKTGEIDLIGVFGCGGLTLANKAKYLEIVTKQAQSPIIKLKIETIRDQTGKVIDFKTLEFGEISSYQTNSLLGESDSFTDITTLEQASGPIATISSLVDQAEFRKQSELKIAKNGAKFYLQDRLLSSSVEIIKSQDVFINNQKYNIELIKRKDAQPFVYVNDQELKPLDLSIFPKYLQSKIAEIGYSINIMNDQETSSRVSLLRDRSDFAVKNTEDGVYKHYFLKVLSELARKYAEESSYRLSTIPDDWLAREDLKRVIFPTENEQLLKSIASSAGVSDAILDYASGKTRSNNKSRNSQDERRFSFESWKVDEIKELSVAEIDALCLLVPIKYTSLPFSIESTLQNSSAYELKLIIKKMHERSKVYPDDASVKSFFDALKQSGYGSKFSVVSNREMYNSVDIAYNGTKRKIGAELTPEEKNELDPEIAETFYLVYDLVYDIIKTNFVPVGQMTGLAEWDNPLAGVDKINVNIIANALAEKINEAKIEDPETRLPAGRWELVLNDLIHELTHLIEQLAGKSGLKNKELAGSHDESFKNIYTLVANALVDKLVNKNLQFATSLNSIESFLNKFEPFVTLISKQSAISSDDKTNFNNKLNNFKAQAEKFYSFISDYKQSHVLGENQNKFELVSWFLNHTIANKLNNLNVVSSQIIDRLKTGNLDIRHLVSRLSDNLYEDIELDLLKWFMGGNLENVDLDSTTKYLSKLLTNSKKVTFGSNNETFTNTSEQIENQLKKLLDDLLPDSKLEQTKLLCLLSPILFELDMNTRKYASNSPILNITKVSGKIVLEFNNDIKQDKSQEHSTNKGTSLIDEMKNLINLEFKSKLNVKIASKNTVKSGVPQYNTKLEISRSGQKSKSQKMPI